MIIIFRGAGGIVLLFFCIVTILLNFKAFFFETPSRFDDSPWWLIFLLTAVFCGWFSFYAEKKNRNPDSTTTLGRMFINWGNKHSIFFIPIKFWAMIFFAVSVWLAYQRFVR
jgi:hypothetical protein